MRYVTSLEQMGREEGRQEEKQTIALNLLRQTVALDIIAQATGLSLEQLQQLRSQLDQA
ncbi:MAG: hypothetical protein MUF49_03175 [Oculatellaceae cyanobacterium Prado106]|jgi:predicted transposase/invertase (TIGR01784 family)|nr:hypothetical protein [Oculatellaceae cyanobacterium Prado106]